MKIGVDISVDEVCGVLVNENLILATQHTTICGMKQNSKKEIMNKVFTLIDNLFNPQVESIGISLPTKIHSDGSIIYDLDRIPHWKNIRLKTIIEERYQVLVVLDNDINCLIWAEKNAGLCREYNNIICIAIDSTIGAGLLVNGKLFPDNQSVFKCLKCLSKVRCQHVRNFSESYIRTLEELVFMVESFRAELENPSHHLWNEVRPIIDRLISIMLINYDTDAILLSGNLSLTDHTIDKPIIHSKLKNARAVGAAYLQI